MKIRSGFVSNSSSTSYVILIPNNFDVDAFVYSHLDEIRKSYREQHYEEFPRYVKVGNKHVKAPVQKVILPFEYIDGFIQRFKKNISKGSMYQNSQNRNYYDMYTIPTIMKSLVISETRGGPDEGIITFVKEDKLKDLANDFKQKEISAEEKELIKNQINAERTEWELKREEKKKAMRHIDPFDEEQWEN
jgi:hypothetical protein